MTLLLGPLEEAIFDTNWQIRHAAVTLTGQLIEQILRFHRLPTQSAQLMDCTVPPLLALVSKFSRSVVSSSTIDAICELRGPASIVLSQWSPVRGCVVESGSFPETSQTWLAFSRFDHCNLTVRIHHIPC